MRLTDTDKYTYSHLYPSIITYEHNEKITVNFISVGTKEIDKTYPNKSGNYVDHLNAVHTYFDMSPNSGISILHDDLQLLASTIHGGFAWTLVPKSEEGELISGRSVKSKQPIRTAITTFDHFCDVDCETYVTAECQAGSIKVLWDDNLNTPENHRSACDQLCIKLDNKAAEEYGDTSNTWTCDKIQAATVDGYVFVFAN